MPSETTPLRAHLREHILCVDDEEGILTALRQQLSARFGDECEIAVAKNAREALELIEELQQDGEPLAVVIADQIMPGMKGVELLEEVHRRSPHTVKILLTGQAGLDAVVYAINKAGLDQYIPKPWDEPDLRLTIENFLSRFRLERERAELLGELRTKNAELATLNSSLEEKVDARTKELEDANARLAELAVTDGLTGLYNHRHFHERLSLEVERSNRTGLPLSVLMIDVDHFKDYNDRHGHLAGDEALRGVSKILQHGRRANDVVARYGGEEFAIILLDVGKGRRERRRGADLRAGRRVPVRVRQHAAERQADDLRSGSPRSPTTAPSRRWSCRPPIARCSRPRTPAAIGSASRGRNVGETGRRRPGRWRVGKRARRDRSATRSRRGAVGDRSRRGGCAGARSHQPALRPAVSPAPRGRGVERHRRRRRGSRHAGGRRSVRVRRGDDAGGRGRAPAESGGVVSGGRLRVEGPGAGHRRDDGRRDRREPAGRGRRRPVRAQLRRRDRARAAGRAGGRVDGRRGRGGGAGLLRRRPPAHLHEQTTSRASAWAAR